MPFYIQRRVNSKDIQTIERLEDAKEAHRKVTEYNVNHPEALHYVVKRPCKSWVDQELSFNVDDRNQLETPEST